MITVTQKISMVATTPEMTHLTPTSLVMNFTANLTRTLSRALSSWYLLPLWQYWCIIGSYANKTWQDGSRHNSSRHSKQVSCQVVHQERDSRNRREPLDLVLGEYRIEGHLINMDGQFFPIFLFFPLSSIALPNYVMVSVFGGPVAFILR
jgi:hypothetical protein